MVGQQQKNINKRKAAVMCILLAAVLWTIVLLTNIIGSGCVWVMPVCTQNILNIDQIAVCHLSRLITDASRIFAK